MGHHQQIDIEIKNSPALSYLLHELNHIKSEIDEIKKCFAILESRISDLEDAQKEEP